MGENGSRCRHEETSNTRGRGIASDERNERASSSPLIPMAPASEDVRAETRRNNGGRAGGGIESRDAGVQRSKKREEGVEKAIGAGGACLSSTRSSERDICDPSTAGEVTVPMGERGKSVRRRGKKQGVGIIELESLGSKTSIENENTDPTRGGSGESRQRASSPELVGCRIILRRSTKELPHHDSGKGRRKERRRNGSATERGLGEKSDHCRNGCDRQTTRRQKTVTPFGKTIDLGYTGAETKPLFYEKREKEHRSTAQVKKRNAKAKGKCQC